MPNIEILSPLVADMIAAGEVVERPGSVVKELMENAVDAGAKNITVELRGGGAAYIRVTDDGCGMSPEDAGVCCLRHATSKLKNERDLEAIGTLGFRGEALAAISSVSRLTLTTRQRGADEGVRVELIAGEIESMTPCGCPEGTTIEVRDLFYNTPARLRFMASDRSEGLSCVQTALRSALGRPEISVRCIRDGEEQFFSPGDGRLDSCVYALLGRDAAKGFLPVDTESEGIRVTGFVSSPAFCRGNRSGQFFFCNGRPIRSKTLTAALEQAYKNAAMVGKFPACVLYITLSNAQVDVNVHPGKLEVKFAREKEVFNGVYYGALSALGGEDRLGLPKEQKPAEPHHAAAPKKDFFRSMTAAEFREKAAASTPISAPARPAAPPVAPVSRPAAPAVRPLTPPVTRPAPVAAPLPASAYKTAPAPIPAPVRPAPASGQLSLRDSGAEYAVGEPAVHTMKPQDSPEESQQVLAEEFRGEPVRLIGEALGVYILVERADKLILIDKHAAHERALFDRLRLDEKPLMSQELLTPETLRCDADAQRVAEENRGVFDRLGFEWERFGEDCILLRAVPADIDPAAAAPLFEELLTKLTEGLTLTVRDVWERLAETVACKAAVKAGAVSSPEELLALAELVLDGEVRYCPHGRPVFQVFTRAELDKRFGRMG